MNNTSMCVQNYRFIRIAEIGFHDIKLKIDDKYCIMGLVLRDYLCQIPLLDMSTLSGC